jgi:hypothetical protein
MYIKENAYVEQTIYAELKLTDEELVQFPFLTTLNEAEKAMLLETVLSLSMILYKTFKNENT